MLAQASSDTLYQAGLWISILVAVVAIAAFVVRRFRDSNAGVGESTGSLLSKFQEVRQEGDISEAEFRKIKAVLGGQLRSEVKETKDKG
ncbi:hypothetical protein Psta_4170 [Pirellula staleyi DSM 6068]|uniref:Uncharacterized protein n=1 Tax=Pirellula staleyi (strain ATCC 27377 / DSM 6068 / ICPB 4128) TaxID=530564 RepID=D2R3X0_PIRSD|nr:hypothetical protein [Pirellula staleyi]ADB18819.1 hypothetical protein Psta_4170 [Pirellula staleyi DSM 6068]